MISTIRSRIGVCLAAAALAGSALGAAAAANASPKTLDIDKLEQCQRDVDTTASINGWGWSQHLRALRKCCVDAGGELVNDHSIDCTAQDEERSPDTGTGQPTKPVPDVPRVDPNTPRA
jgi:hypothetical protein